MARFPPKQADHPRLGFQPSSAVAGRQAANEPNTGPVSLDADRLRYVNMSPRKGMREILSGRRAGLAADCLRGVLAAAEPLYGWYVRRRNRGYDDGRLPITHVEAPVISVGNLTVGGTGKTPLVCWLATWFKARGIDVTLISRGYGRAG